MSSKILLTISKRILMESFILSYNTTEKVTKRVVVSNIHFFRVHVKYFYIGLFNAYETSVMLECFYNAIPAIKFDWSRGF